MIRTLPLIAQLLLSPARAQTRLNPQVRLQMTEKDLMEDKNLWSVIQRGDPVLALFISPDGPGAEQILVTREALDSAWGSRPAGDSDSELLQLNRKAATVWSSMVLCAGGGREGAAKARLRYLLGGGFCDRPLELGGLKLDDETILRSLLKLRMEVRGLLENGPPPSGKPPKVHPLVPQIVLENLAVSVNFVLLDKGGGFRCPDRDPGECAPEEHARVREMADNALRLLLLLPEDCSQYGLWPMSSRSLISALNRLSYTFLRVNMRETEALQARAFKSCGPLKPGGGDTYSDLLASFVREYRTIAEEYRPDRAPGPGTPPIQDQLIAPETYPREGRP